MTSRSNRISEDKEGEAYAYLRLLAPKLEKLRSDLTASNARLNDPDAPTGRLNAIIETQLALKEFLSGLPNLSSLIEPIDILLALLNEEAAEPAPEPPPPPVPTLAEKITPSPVRDAAAASDAWLRVGTVAAVRKLTTAGMSASNAETYVERSYATARLTHSDGRPIAADEIKSWLGPSAGAWRRARVLKPKLGGTRSGPIAIAEAQARVDELAAIFKKMGAAANA